MQSITELKKEMDSLSDKILHCLARTFQDNMEGTCVGCLYCKYAFECSEEYKKSDDMLRFAILDKLKACTSVDIFLNPETKSVDILKGSWAEKYSDVLKMLTNKSFDEQQDILKDQDILQYADN